VPGRRGSIEEGADGWVEWCTEDDSWSYVPSLSCGSFVLLINRGAHWNVPFGKGEARIEWLTDEGEEIEFKPRSITFEWRREEMRAACAYLAAAQDHPEIDFVVRAADVLWGELLKDDLQEVRSFILKQLSNHGAKTQAQLTAEWRMQQKTTADEAVRDALAQLMFDGHAVFDANRLAGYGGAWILKDMVSTASTVASSSSMTHDWEAALTLNQIGRDR
jgi:putative sterol carrier protein